jgi:hypothetical protein
LPLVSDSAPGFLFRLDALREHWQGHRRLTRRVIEAFPEDQLFHYSVGGMRPFAAMAIEMLSMAAAGIRGVAIRDWTMVSDLDHHSKGPKPATRQQLLARWDEVTTQIDTLWPQIPPGRFEEVDKAFGEWEGVVYGLLLYWIDNEIHHRGQGYVFLRSLGIDPPAFYNR